MYEAFHHITPLIEKVGAGVSYDVVGPVCESGDWIGRDRTLNVKAGDTLAVLSAGAYCMSMSSNYNSRGRAAEILVDGSATHLIRQRENPAQLMAGEVLVG
jgi:diaminopimelate decarboxylase